MVAAAVWAAACGGSPTTPTPDGTADDVQFYTLSGIISERGPSGLVPLAGVEVRQTNTTQLSVTDQSGSFTLRQVPKTVAISATKADYATIRRTLTLSSDTTLDFEMKLLSAQLLFGTVFQMTEEGPVGIEDVWVYCDSCGSPVGHTAVLTDRSGDYSFAWANDGVTPLMVSKEGYRLAAPAPGSRTDTVAPLVNGNTRFDIELVVR